MSNDLRGKFKSKIAQVNQWSVLRIADKFCPSQSALLAHDFLMGRQVVHLRSEPMQ